MKVNTLIDILLVLVAYAIDMRGFMRIATIVGYGSHIVVSLCTLLLRVLEAMISYYLRSIPRLLRFGISYSHSLSVYERLVDLGAQ